jgi:ribonuclease HII
MVMDLQKESILNKLGYRHIAGIDEVGRGPLAGPVVAAAIIFPCDHTCLSKVKDSKLLTPTTRESLAFEILAQSLAVGVGSCCPTEIDQLNIYQATKTAMRRAIQNLQTKPDYLLIDGNMRFNDLGIPYESIIKGDAQIYSIAAASIVAKVFRDYHMKIMHAKYPEYDFLNNKGYGTKKHRAAIEKCGIIKGLHRKSFKGCQ